MATPLLASPLGGMLWHLHDMLAGYFPDSWGQKLMDGAGEGIMIGWLIILMSVPYNAICAVLGILGTRRVAQRLYPLPEAAAGTSTPGIKPDTTSPAPEQV